MFWRCFLFNNVDPSKTSFELEPGDLIVVSPKVFLGEPSSNHWFVSFHQIHYLLRRQLDDGPDLSLRTIFHLHMKSLVGSIPRKNSEIAVPIETFNIVNCHLNLIDIQMVKYI